MKSDSKNGLEEKKGVGEGPGTLWPLYFSITLSQHNLGLCFYIDYGLDITNY